MPDIEPILSPHYCIQVAQEKDLDAILEVYRQCEDFLALGPVPTASMPMVLADLDISTREGGTFCCIFDRDGSEVLGIVDFVTSGWEGEAGYAFLSLLMISSQHRSKGVGAEIVQAVEREMCKNPALKAIWSGVQINNPGAIRFWQRMGYQIVSEAEQMEDGTVAYRLYKPQGPRSL